MMLNDAMQQAVNAQINNVTFAGDKSRGFIRFRIIIP